MKRSFIVGAIVIFLCMICGKGGLPLAFILSLIVHEVGHLLAAKLLGARIISIGGGMIGLRIKYDFLSVSPVRESVVCISGSIFGILAAYIALASGLAVYDSGIDFIATSLTFSIMNLLPVRGLDGGEILMCILERFTLPDRAYRICNTVSSATALIFWVTSIRIQMRHGINLSMLIMSVYFLYISGFAGKA